MTTRRSFLKTAAATAAAAGFPTIVPSSVFGATAPSNRIHIGAIGVGRISRGHDMPGVWQYTGVAGRDNRIVAVCDLSAARTQQAQQLVDQTYTKKLGQPYTGTRGYADYRELLAQKDIDAVLISTPDHQHARLAVAAIKARKDVYLQKPASLTIAEGRIMADHAAASSQIVQIGSQQRSWKQFARAVELVRNGRIGIVRKVEIGLPGDPAGGNPQPMPVPADFNYDAWLGSTPVVPYTLDRVMPTVGFDRPGWLRMEQFGAGMITGWGAHHVDTAHWGMNTELTGPVEIWGQAEFPKDGLWDVHGPFKSYGRYANGVEMTISGAFENGIKWIGDDGWLFVCRDGMTTPTAAATPSAAGSSAAPAAATLGVSKNPATTANTGNAPAAANKPEPIIPLRASNPKVLDSVIGPNEWHAYTADDHHGNWLDCIQSRKPNIATAEIGHRACSTCLLHWMAMKTDHHIHWDPKTETIQGDDIAAALLSRHQRQGYEIA